MTDEIKKELKRKQEDAKKFKRKKNLNLIE